MKKHIILLTVFVLVFGWSANAQLFWKVSGNGLTRESYLFGTHHLIDKSQIKDFDKILGICAQCDATVGEIVMKDPSIQMKLMQGAMMTEGTIKDLVSPEDYALLDNEFYGLIGAGMDKLGKMKPMMLSSMYSIMVYCQKNNLTKQPEAVDQLFQNEAENNGKKVLGLETVEDQVNIMFNSLPLKRQADLLVECVKGKESGIEILNKLNASYLAGDLKELEALGMQDQGDMTEEEMALFNEDRNHNWMKKIPALISEQSCFIAVGCLHLTSEIGLVSQLKKAGYKVEPVNF
jgi:hypothetical protein